MTEPFVCHVSPTYFASESVIGGGERFAEELARAMAKRVPVKFVSFGPRAFRERPSPSFERVILKSWSRDRMLPISPRLFAELEGADVIHCHQLNVLSTFLAAWWGGRRGRRVFVSDLGGGGWTPGYHLDPSRWITAHLPISRYAAGMLSGRNRRFRVIYGGVDLERFRARPQADHDGSVVFLGRLLPHKGVHHLIEAAPSALPVHVVGTVSDAAYRDHLVRLARGKSVSFHSGLGDAEVIALLQRAMALVHPTPVDDRGSAGIAELFGLSLVEAMACGCPVVASRVASLPEIVEDEVTGLLVEPNQPAAITAALARLAGDGRRWACLSLAARERVESAFTWQRVAARCFDAYSSVSFEQAAPAAA